MTPLIDLLLNDSSWVIPTEWPLELPHLNDPLLNDSSEWPSSSMIPLNDSSWVTPTEWPVQMAAMKVSYGLHGLQST